MWVLTTHLGREDDAHVAQVHVHCLKERGSQDCKLVQWVTDGLVLNVG